MKNEHQGMTCMLKWLFCHPKEITCYSGAGVGEIHCMLSESKGWTIGFIINLIKA